MKFDSKYGLITSEETVSGDALAGAILKQIEEGRSLTFVPAPTPHDPVAIVLRESAASGPFLQVSYIMGENELELGANRRLTECILRLGVQINDEENAT